MCYEEKEIYKYTEMRLVRWVSWEGDQITRLEFYNVLLIKNLYKFIIFLLFESNGFNN